MGSQVLATEASVTMKLLVFFAVASFVVISTEASQGYNDADADEVNGEELGDGRKDADEPVVEADADEVYGEELGDSLSFLQRRSAQPRFNNSKRHRGKGKRKGRWRKDADEPVVEADADEVYGEELGDSLSFLQKRSAQPRSKLMRIGRGRRI